MTTSERYPQGHCANPVSDRSISSPADTLASRSVHPESAKGKLIRDTSGLRCEDSLESFAPVGSWQRMCADTLVSASTPSWRTWKVSTTKQGRSFFLLRRSVPRRKGNEFSSWPTPAAGIPNDGESIRSWMNRRDRSKRAGPLAANGKISPQLAVAVMIQELPGMPTGPDGSGLPKMKWLDHAASLLGMIPEYTLAELGERRLSPHWVEALMGFPPGWTEPDGPPHPDIRRIRASRQGPCPEEDIGRTA